MLKITGKKEILNNEVLIVEGGFGEGKKILLDTQIAEIHNSQTKHVREAINKLIARGRLSQGVDFIDIKIVVEQIDNNIISNFYSKMEFSKAKNIYALSERGYTKLIKMFSDDKSWDIMEQIIDEYFTMRSYINSLDTQKNTLLLQLFSDDPIAVASAHKQLVALEVKPLQDKIKEDEPLVAFGKTVLKAEGNILVRELAKIACGEGIQIGERTLYKKLREWKLIIPASTEPYQKYINSGYFVVEEKVFTTPYGDRLARVTKITPKGQIAIINKLKKENI